MSLRIGTNVGSLAIQTSINKSERELLRATKNVASGSRLSDSSVDSAGLAISEKLKADIKSFEAAQRNVAQATSFSAIAEGALAEQANILVRMRELAIQSSSDTYSNQERSFMQTEYSSLQSEIDRIAQVTNYGSQKLLNGSSSELDIQVGKSADQSSRIIFDSETNTTLSSLGLSSSSVRDKSDARDAIDASDEAMQLISSLRAKYGALQSRLESTESNLLSTIEALSSARSQIYDADIPKEVSNLRKQQILQQYQSSLLQQTNEQAGSILRLIG